ncbi:MAG: cation:proton antiporter, partial [Clostridia bacterium]|nr:cation:proton antiporter [Clostridia bacterium]
MHAEALSLLVISLAVAVLPSVARVLRLPAAVVEIAFGVVLGK